MKQKQDKCQDRLYLVYLRAKGAKILEFFEKHALEFVEGVGSSQKKNPNYAVKVTESQMAELDKIPGVKITDKFDFYDIAKDRQALVGQGNRYLRNEE